MAKPLNQLMQKEMSRKEFMAALFFGMASVMGMSTLIRLMTGKSADHQLGKRLSSDLGYGGGTYGR